MEQTSFQGKWNMTKLQTTSMEAYASFTDTVNTLNSLGHEDRLRVDSSGIDAEYGDFVLHFKCGDKWRVTEGQVYQCGLGYYCVSIDETIWQAPVVWNGPRAAWDTSTNESLLREFVVFVLEVLEMS